MAQEISFNEFLAKVKTEFAKNVLPVPEDMELVELAHMECIADEAFPDEFIRKMVAEYKETSN